MAARFWGIALFGILAMPTLGLSQQLEEGLHYYAIEDLERGEIIVRGEAGSNGVAFDNLLLAPQTRFRAYVLQAATFRVGRIEFTTGTAGSSLELGAIVLRLDSSLDSDGDGLSDLGEAIVGTSTTQPDTDDDGLGDAEEVRTGQNPNDNSPARTGIIATVDLPGDAVDLDAAGNITVVAHGGQITVLNTFAGLRPEILARVTTPGDARRVACSEDLVAVADGQAGLTVIDASDPPAARVTQQLVAPVLGGVAQSVAAVARVAYVGLDTGYVVAVDLVGGIVLTRVRVASEPVTDLAISGGVLYVVSRTQLHTIELGQSTFDVDASLTGANLHSGYLRLIAGEDLLYAVSPLGYQTFDLTNPLQPVLIADTPSSVPGWLDLAIDGSGRALGSRGGNPAPNAARDVTLFDVSDPAQTDLGLTTFTTPGVSRALEIANGFGLVADGTRGLHVVNFRSPDVLGVAPTIALGGSFDLVAGAEEGQLAFLRADVDDDVGLRNVEFTVNGRTISDPVYPYELTFVTPLLSEQSSIRVRARVYDVGGNFTDTQEFVVPLLPDATPPELQAVAPRDGAFVSRAGAALAQFNEVLDSDSLSGAVSVVSAGPDLALGTADDVPVSVAVSFREQVRQLVVAPTAGGDFEPGRYRVTLGPGLADLRGNEFGASFSWSFLIFGGAEADADGDGLPDLYELAVGLDPNNPVSLPDGIPDGDRDPDNDGLGIAFELQLGGTDPGNPDSDMDGTPDGLEDPDQDQAINLDEQAAGSDPLDPDSDDDRFVDGEELLEGSSPIDAQSLPLFGALGSVSLRNDAPPAIGTALGQVSLRNDARGNVLNTAVGQASVRNDTYPLVGEATGPAVSVENQTTSSP